MSQLASKRILTGLAAAGLALSSVAYAADAPPGPPRPLPVDSMLSGLTITAPRTIEKTRYGVVSQIVKMSVSVPYSDLDMHTAAGVETLNKRVKDAANYVCNELERMYPTGSPEEFYCAKQAVTEAQPQVVLARGP